MENDSANRPLSIIKRSANAPPDDDPALSVVTWHNPTTAPATPLENGDPLHAKRLGHRIF